MTQPPRAASIPPVERVGSYILLRRIGSGGMAEVWLGRHVVSGGSAAVKRLAPDARDRPSIVEFLASEARVIARLSHPHIVPLFEYGDGFVVMPYIEGVTLSRRMQRPVDAATAIRIVRQVASALAHAHERGVIHRDVKPSNILLDRNETAYLSDFGIAASPDGPGHAAGTPRYMAPEQGRGEPVGPSADQYGLARTLLEVLGGGHLPGLPDEACAALPATLPPALRAALERGLAAQPAERFPSIAAFADALAAIDLQGFAPSVRLARAQREVAPNPWLTGSLSQHALGPDIVCAEYRLRDLVARGFLRQEVIDPALGRLGLADIGFSVYTATARLGALTDPALLSRVTEVIVLVHGWTCTRFAWRTIAPSLCRDNPLALVVVPDLHGAGETRWVGTPTRAQASLRSMADSVLVLARLLGIDAIPTVLLAHSMGAMSLLTVDDADLPDNVARVLLNPVFPSKLPAVRRAFLAAALVVSTLGRFEWMRRVLVAWVLRDPNLRGLAPVDRAALSANLQACWPGATERVLIALATAPFRAGRQRRVTLISGVDDPLMRDEDVLRAAAAQLGLDPAHVHRIASGGHSPHLSLVMHPEWAARNIDEIARIVQSMILTAHEPTTTPTLKPAAGETMTYRSESGDG